MPDLELGLGSDVARVASAILFIQASTNAFDIYSALNSSPWTAQSFGADPEKRKACMEYVHHSLGVTAFYSGSAAVLAKNWWPIVGWAIASGYMYYLYKRALDRAQESGSTDWGDSGSKAAAPVPGTIQLWSQIPAPTPAMNGSASTAYPWSA